MNEDFLRHFLASSGWQQAQDLLREISGTHILWVVSSSGKPIQRSSRGYPHLCKLVRKSTKGLGLCKHFHNVQFQESIKTGQPAVSACYCGLAGFAIPLALDNEIIGVACGCHHQAMTFITAEKCAEVSSICGIDLKTVMDYASGIRPMSPGEQERFLSILSMFTGMTSVLMKWMNILLLTSNLQYQYAAKVSSLSEIGMLAASELDWEEMLATITSKTKILLDVDACSIYILDQSHQELVLSATDGLPPSAMGQRIKIGDGIAGQVARTRSAVVFEDTTRDPRSKSLLLPSEPAREVSDYRSILSMPLIAQDRFIGVIDACTFQPKTWTQTDVSFLSAIAVHVAGIIEKSKFRMEVSRELEVARYIQAKLLPDSLPKVGGYDLSARTIPHREVGGDYYDFIPMGEDLLGIAIADVCGKGIGAAILMANTRGVVHTHARPEVRVKDVMSEINNALHDSTELDKFVTMFYGVLDAKKGSFTYTNAGHNHPFVYRAGHIYPQALDVGGIVLGMMKDIEYLEGEVQLEDGDIVVLYSDGVTEAHNENGNLFGEKRLHEVVYKYMKERQDSFSAQNLLSRIYNAVRDFSSNVPVTDDLTIVVICKFTRAS